MTLKAELCYTPAIKQQNRVFDLIITISLDWQELLLVIIQMITEKPLKERELDELYDWVDSLQLSRPKKNISRDFSDATMMAEVIAHHFPKIVELHNYPPTNALKSKLSNWTTLNNKVLSKLGLSLTPEDCRRLSSSTPGSVEALLYEFKALAMENLKEKQDEERQVNDNGLPLRDNPKEDIANKLYAASKVEELREVLALIKEKISVVERSIDRKDAHIRELEDILKHYSN